MLVLGVSCHVCEDSSGRNTVGLGGPCVLMKVGPRALGKVGGGGGGPLVNMGAGGDGPCLLSWLLRCAETSLSKWNPQPDWQAGRRAPSNRSSQPESKCFHFEVAMLWIWQGWAGFGLRLTLVAALEVSKGVLEPIPCLNPPKELAASLACIQGRSNLKC